MTFAKRANLQGVREVRYAAPPGVDEINVDGKLESVHWGIDTRISESTDPAFWTYRGEASVVDNAYTVRDAYGEFSETIHDGAFKRTLAEDPLVSFVWMHQIETTMAQTRGRGLDLSTNPHLLTEARISKSDPDAQRLEAKSHAGLAAAMSFGFRVSKQQWNDDYTVRDIFEVNLHGGDVSAIVTGHGANPAAAGELRLDYDAVLRFIEEHDLADEQAGELAALVTRSTPEVPQSIRADLAALYAVRPF